MENWTDPFCSFLSAPFHSYWRGGNFDEKLWASNWYTHFPGDSRNRFTWQNYFGNLGGSVYNFYSTGENVVQNAPDEEVWLIEALGDSIFNQGRGAWFMQEKVKGLNGISIDGDFFGIGVVFELSMPDQHGGWRINDAYFDLVGDQESETYIMNISPAQAAALSPESLRTQPFFRDFESSWNRYGFYNGDALLAPLNDPAANAQANDDLVLYKILAEAIPALSFAAAANAVVDFNEFGVRNFDINNPTTDFKNGWPQERLNDPDLQSDWLHSDLKNVAFVYVQKYYQKFVEIGELNHE